MLSHNTESIYPFTSLGDGLGAARGCPVYSRTKIDAWWRDFGMLCESHNFPTCLRVFTLFPLVTASQERLLDLNSQNQDLGIEGKVLVLPSTELLLPSYLSSWFWVKFQPWSPLQSFLCCKNGKIWNKWVKTTNKSTTNKKSQTNKNHDEDGS